MLKLTVVTFFLFFHFISYAGNASLKQIKISSIKDLRVIDQYRKLVFKAYTDIGYEVEFKEMPAARAVFEINKGTVDALVIRFSVIEKSNPDLIRVPVVLATGELFLYCQIGLPCDQSVVDEPLNLIGAIIGHNFTTVYLEGHAASVYKTTTANQLAEMLSRNRLNYILASEVDGLGSLIELDKSKFNTFKLDRLEAYHYIHRRIENILPELTLSLKNIIDENSKH